jgi:hypothetical protein
MVEKPSREAGDQKPKEEREAARKPETQRSQMN